MTNMEFLRMGITWLSCTVQGNQTLEIAACALFDTSNGANWAQFQKDCCHAFETTANAPKRPWKVALADGDGCIHSAVKAADSEVEMWNCYKHFDGQIKSKHLSSATQWSPVHHILFKILTSDSAVQMPSWVRHSIFLFTLILKNNSDPQGERGKDSGGWNHYSRTEKKGGGHVGGGHW